MLIPIIGQDDSISNMSNKIEAVHVQAITDNREQCWPSKETADEFECSILKLHDIWSAWQWQ